MAQIGGNVTIESEVGRGTKVTLLFPLAPEDEVEPERSVPSPQPLLEPGSKTVLVVEDDPAVRMLIVSVLEELGLKFIEAADGNAGWAILKSASQIDLLISDVGLPGTNGRQLAEMARQVRPTLAVLFVTGYAEGAALRPADLLPGMHLMTKPFDVPTLGSTIRNMLAFRSFV